MSEYVIAKKQDLINIADAIREKSGINGGLALPEAMIQAIAGIGNGIKMSITSFTQAEDNTWENIYAGYAISSNYTHGLGEVPNLFIVYSPDAEVITGVRYLKGAYLFCGDINNVEEYISLIWGQTSKTAIGFLKQGGNNGNYLITDSRSGASCLFYDVNDTTMRIDMQYSTYPMYIQGGATYYVIVGRVEL